MVLIPGLCMCESLGSCVMPTITSVVVLLIIALLVTFSLSTSLCQLLIWYIPLTCYLNHLLSSSHSHCHFIPFLCHPLIYHSLMLFLFLLHCCWCVVFAPYSAIALTLSPGISWTIVLSVYLILQSWRAGHRVTSR